VTSTSNLKVGVLGFQGAISEHVEMVNLTLRSMGLKGSALTVKSEEQLDEIHGLIIPGGESTTIGLLSKRRGLVDGLVKMAGDGMVIMGTCAGLVVMARQVSDLKVDLSSQPLLGLIDMKVTRNGFGRQKASFETDLSIPLLGEEAFHAVFIRAPVIEAVGGEAEVIARYDGKAVGVQQKNLLATSFHPELSKDLRLHQYFIKKVQESTFVS